MYFCIKGRRGASLPLSKSLKGRSGTGPTKSFGAGRLEKKKSEKNMSGVNFGYGKNADFMIVFMIISCFWTRYVHIISNS